MLFLVRMTVTAPTDGGTTVFEDRRREERDYALRLQRAGTWRHLWRVAGRYENYSVFDVESHEELDEVLAGLPLHRYLHLEVTPLARHPSSLDDETPKEP